MSRQLVLIGSGETGPTMVSSHQRLAAGVPKTAASMVVLDSSYGFQQNADELTAKISQYFSDSVGRSVTSVSLRRPDGTVQELAAAIKALRTAEWAFAGPGSPTYALDVWRQTGLAAEMLKLLDRGSLLLASAAAVTAGARALPVYEIYKVGERPSWRTGLNLLGAATGLQAAVVPHYNNAEGGSHDTRYCFIGGPRMEMLENELTAGQFILGVDELTGVAFDLDEQVAEVFGRGAMTVRVAGTEVKFPSGEKVPLAAIEELVAQLLASAPATFAMPEPTLPEPTLPESRIEVVINEEVDRAEVIRPFVDAILQLRDSARAARRFDEADQIRRSLEAEGLVVEDTADGVKWRLAD